VTVEKTLSETYEDRNAAVLALAEMVRVHGNQVGRYGPDFRACWSEPEPDDADADAEEWALVYVFLPSGQVSWHVPRELAEKSNLPEKTVEWDGHTRAEKNGRLRQFSHSG
jgi:hypothetical protein